MSSYPRTQLPRRHLLEAVALCWLLVSAVSCTQAPNVVLIVIDTLRADRLGVYGNAQGLTPFLDELAARGTVFANAYAPSSWTCPSVASILTSRYPSQHQVNSFAAKLANEEFTIGESLAERGYVGGGFSANFRLSEVNGYAQGFSSWRAYLSSPGQPKVRASLLRRDSLAWVQSVRRTQPAAPIFLYLQFMEPHAPYRPPEPFRTRLGRGANDAAREDQALKKLTSVARGTKNLSPGDIDMLASLYDGEVAAIDDELAQFVIELQSAGVLANALLIVTADHGEEFAEHGHMLHGFSLFEPGIRVPLIVTGPGVPRGRVVSERVSLVDIAPTVLELLGIARPDRYVGRSLVATMAAASAERPPADSHASGTVVSELVGDSDVRVHECALIAGGNKLLMTPAGKAVGYDLDRDPGEQRPLETSAVAFADLTRRLAQMRTAWSAGTREAAPSVALDDATRETLRALGYQP